ncbi:TPA: hypothetical protein ACH3X1_007762 [Trebouxia sp. C0004]
MSRLTQNLLCCISIDPATNDCKGITRWNAHNKIDHLTAHQLAFVDVKVRSLLNGEPSIPKTATEQEVIIEHYEQMVSMLQDPNFRSKYATIVDSEPHTPT